ncbi:MAG: hypothetical protein KDK36_20255, partial [Leptospiraceae bacterium]|nr:hypothetical protein [Leptospiraceae bacterium]
MICPNCNSIHSGFPGRLCPVCSEPLVMETEKAREKVYLGKFKTYINNWKDLGKISSNTFKEIDSAIDSELKPKKVKIKESPSLLSLFFQWLDEFISSIFQSISSLYEPFIITKEKRNNYSNLDSEDSTDGIFSDSGNLTGLGNISELDDKRNVIENLNSENSIDLIRMGLKPLLNEYIWWFIGTLLILTGSIMGVREAWINFSGINRLFILLFALCSYQTLFTLLGLLLKKKSILTAELLSIISLLLFPVLFSLSSDILIRNVILGIGTISILFLFSFFLLKITSNIFDSDVFNFLFSIIPICLFQSVIPYLKEEVLAVLLVMLPLVIVSYNSFEVQKRDARAGKGFLFLSIYCSLATLFIFINRTEPNIFFLKIGSESLGVLLIWSIFFSGILASTFGHLGSKIHYLNAYRVVEIICLAIILVFSIFGGFYIYFFPSNTIYLDSTRLLYVFLPFVGTFHLAKSIKLHNYAVHPFYILLILSAYVIFQEIIFILNWGIFISLFLPISTLLFYNQENRILKQAVIFWGLVSTFIASFYYLFQTISYTVLPLGEFHRLTQIENVSLFTPSILLGATIFILSHHLGKKENQIFHLLGSLGLLTFLSGPTLLFGFYSPIFKLSIILLITSAFYSIIPLFYKSIKTSDYKGKTFLPFDDIRVITSLIGIIILLFSANSLDIYGNYIILLSGIILLFSLNKDFSTITGLITFGIISISIFQIILSNLTASFQLKILISSIFTICISLFNFFFTYSENPIKKTRKVLFDFRLPFPSKGKVSIHDSLSILYLAFSIYTFFQIISWLGITEQPQRNIVIYSGLILSSGFIFQFLFKLNIPFKFKGSAFTFFLIFFSIGMTAIVNRIGRPLPPMVVGVNLTLGVIALWIFCGILFIYGNKIATFLKNSTQGKYYFFIPLFSSLLLGIVLFIDIFLLTPTPLPRLLYVIPPTFFLGASLSLILFHFYFDKFGFIHAGLFLFIIFCGLMFSQESFKGIELIPIDPPGGRWVPFQTFEASVTDWLNPAIFLPKNLSSDLLNIKFISGIALSSVVFSLVVLLLKSLRLIKYFINFSKSEEAEYYIDTFSFWSTFSIIFLFISAFKYAFILPAFIALGGIFFLLITKQIKTAQLGIGLLLIIIYQGLLNTYPSYPPFSGPVVALLSFILIISVDPIAKRNKKSYGKTLERFHFASLLYGIIAIMYSFSSFLPTDPFNSIPVLIGNFFSGIFINLFINYTPGLTLTILSLCILYGSFQWKKSITTIGAFLGSILLITGLITTFPKICTFGFCNNTPNLIDLIPYFLLLISIVQILSDFFSSYLISSREDYSIGLSSSFHFSLIISAFFLGIFTRFGNFTTVKFSSIMGGIAILGFIFISIRNAYRTKKPIYFYYSQVTISSLYLYLKPAFPEILTPQVDSLFAIIFGFILVGITTIAKRKNIPPLAESTRRFAALMPVFAILLSPFDNSYQNAGIATISSILYASLAITTSFRLYAVLSALSANLAIFMAVTANDIQGLEVYLAPIGLFTIFLGHIFKENLYDRTRQMIRIAGGLFLYLPSA